MKIGGGQNARATGGPGILPETHWDLWVSRMIILDTEAARNYRLHGDAKFLMMTTLLTKIRVAPGLLTVAAVLLAGMSQAANWPQFRGPTADGRAVGGDLPLKWSEQENIRWKTRIHDFGHSSPVIWGEQVWVTAATEDGKRLFAVCCDRATGRIVHDVQVFEVAKPENINSLNHGRCCTRATRWFRVRCSPMGWCCSARASAKKRSGRCGPTVTAT